MPPPRARARPRRPAQPMARHRVEHEHRMSLHAERARCGAVRILRASVPYLGVTALRPVLVRPRRPTAGLVRRCPRSAVSSGRVLGCVSRRGAAAGSLLRREAGIQRQRDDQGCRRGHLSARGRLHSPILNSPVRWTGDIDRQAPCCARHNRSHRQPRFVLGRSSPILSPGDGAPDELLDLRDHLRPLRTPVRRLPRKSRRSGSSARALALVKSEATANSARSLGPMCCFMAEHPSRMAPVASRCLRILRPPSLLWTALSLISGGRDRGRLARGAPLARVSGSPPLDHPAIRLSRPLRTGESDPGRAATPA